MALRAAVLSRVVFLALLAGSGLAAAETVEPARGPGRGAAAGHGREVRPADRRLGGPFQVRSLEGAVRRQRRGDESLRDLPQRGGRPHQEDDPLDLGLHQSQHRPAFGQRKRHQQFLHQRQRQRRHVRPMPYRQRRGKRRIRLQETDQRRLPRLSRQHLDLLPPAADARARSLRRAVRRQAAVRPRQRRAARRSAGTRELRRLPLQRRRRRRRQTRRPRFVAQSPAQGAGRAHVGRRGQFRLHRMPPHQEPRHRRQPLRHDRQGRKGPRRTGPAARRGDLRILSRRSAASQAES